MDATRRSFAIATGAALVARAQQARSSANAEIHVESVRRLFHNGEHNAFTDLVRFKGTYYLTFRTCPDGHMVHPTSAILVLASRDGGEWRQVHRFSVPLRDVRDPHFLIFQDKLFIYTGTWYCGETSPAQFDMNQHLGYAAWTVDGARWDDPRMLEGTYGHYIWRAAATGGKAFLCGRRKREFIETKTRQEQDASVEAAMLESTDGLVWRTAALFQPSYGNETAFLFERDGSVVALARGGGSRNAEVLRAPAPYRTWKKADLGRYLGGPLLAKWGSRYLVGGRKQTPAGPRMTLAWLAGDRLEELVELPSGGDNSYPGFVPLSATQGWLSYYSSHEKDASGKTITAIYLATLRLQG
ncbi:MAG: hypothetical protein ABI972_15925 [Acidobacteriota bacterium]